MKKTLLILFFTFLIPVSVHAQVQLSCSVKTTCSSGDVDVFHMSNVTNAHAELPTQSNHANKVCCGIPGISGVSGLGNGCSGTYKTVLMLSDVTNAHAEEENGGGNYGNSVCLNISHDSIECGYVTNKDPCTNLGPGYACVATISDVTNAHVASCTDPSSYDTKACCAYIDQTKPDTTISPNGVSWTNLDVPFTLTCIDTGGYTIYYSIIDEGQSCGTFSTGAGGTVSCPSGSVCRKNVCYYSTDTSGNQETAKTSSVFKIDKQPPVTTDNLGTGWYGNNTQVALTCDDTSAGSGCNKTYYCVYEGGTPCNPSTEGNTVIISCSGITCTKALVYQSTDVAGNAGVIKGKIVRIDTTIPTCTMTPLKYYSNSSSINLSWSATSVGSKITTVTLENNETGTWEPLPLGVFTQASGSYSFTTGQNNKLYYFRCTAINEISASGPSLPVNTFVDTQAPTGVYISSTAQPITNTTTFTVSWSGDDYESGIVNYTVSYKNGSAQYALWKNFDSQTKSADFGQGSDPLLPANNVIYKFKVAAVDRADNSQESGEISVLVDTVKPSCTIDNMPAYQSSNSFTVGWSGLDGESGIKEYIIEQKNGTSGVWFQFYKGTQTSNNIDSIPDGIYRFKCKAIDNANNMGDFSPEKNTTVDNNPPEMQINYSTSIGVEEDLIITATITDAIKVSSTVLYYNNTVLSNPIVTKNLNQSIWDVKWTISSPLPIGLNTFKIYVEDINGNSQEQTFQFMAKQCEENDVRPCGACGSGNSTCKNGNWTACKGEDKSLVKPEVCNGIDDDCSSIIDDIGGSTSVAVTHCACTYKTAETIIVMQSQKDDCNGIDDNCNDQIDENGGCCEENNTQTCGSSIGKCQYGTKTCRGGKWGPCEGGVSPDSSEICGNNIDDNCNGQIDDGNCQPCIDSDNDGYGSPASNQCKYPEEDCDDSDPNINPGMQEICDGKDNNCDGNIDEGLGCEHCSNAEQDVDEEGVDCGGTDCPACFVWGWLFLTAGGVVILIILAVVWLHFKKQGRELTWEELKKKWTPSK